MGSSNEEFPIQVNVKSGRPDDRGNPLDLINVRGHTARDVADHLRDLIDRGVPELMDELRAVNTLNQEFPSIERLEQQYSNQPQQEICQAHNLPRKYQTGVKNGKKWAGWFCSADKSQGQCAVKWVE